MANYPTNGQSLKYSEWAEEEEQGPVFRWDWDDGEHYGWAVKLKKGAGEWSDEVIVPPDIDPPYTYVKNFFVAGLEPDTYYWDVAYFNLFPTEYFWRGVWSFTITSELPGKPTNPSPAHEATDITLDESPLSWDAG